MKKYYIGLPYLLIGLLAAAAYVGISFVMVGNFSIGTIAIIVMSMLAAAVVMLDPVAPWSVFTVEGSVIREERLFEKEETRQADLSATGMKLYKWQATNGLWLIASEEELTSAEAAKACYKQKKAVMAPVNNQLQYLLSAWVNQAKEIS